MISTIAQVICDQGVKIGFLGSCAFAGPIEYGCLSFSQSYGWPCSLCSGGKGGHGNSAKAASSGHASTSKRAAAGPQTHVKHVESAESLYAKR
jgi:hypothetical protein